MHLRWQLKNAFSKRQLLFRKNGQWHQRTTSGLRGPAFLLGAALFTVVPTTVGLIAYRDGAEAQQRAATADARLEKQLRLSAWQAALIDRQSAVLDDAESAVRIAKSRIDAAGKVSDQPLVVAQLRLHAMALQNSAQEVFDLEFEGTSPPITLAPVDGETDEKLRALEQGAAIVSDRELTGLRRINRLREDLARAHDAARIIPILEQRNSAMSADLATVLAEKGALESKLRAVQRTQLVAATPPAAASPPGHDLKQVEQAAIYFQTALDASTARQATLRLKLLETELKLLRAEQSLRAFAGEQAQAIANLEQYTADAVQNAKDMLVYMGLSSDKLGPQIAVLKERGAVIGDRELIRSAPVPSRSTTGQPAIIEPEAANAPGKGGPFEPLVPSQVQTDFGEGLALSSSVIERRRRLQQLESHVRTLDYYRLLLSILPLGRPIPDRSKRLSSGFGRRVDPIRGGNSFHRGIDYEGNTGDRVVATADGVVIAAKRWAEYGNFIEIRHISGLTTRYAHLSKISVSVGQSLSRGQKIGEVGSTGRSTAPHLHYEVKLNGKRIDPRPLVEIGLNIL